MQQKHMITKEDIKNAARLFLHDGAFFDEERVTFIQNLQIRDLCAVPGSGKTTALQAKIWCLLQHQGKDFNEGILSLSYTNSAVASIKNKFASLASNVAKYPNYVGTVHSFLNRFIANTVCQLLYQTKIHICDDDKYAKELRHQITRIRGGYKLISYLERHNVDDISKLYIDYNSYNICKSNGEIFLKAKHASDSYKIFCQAKTAVSRKGVFSFNDPINLSIWAIDNIPDVAKTLRNRFKYVFVDEAQDLTIQLIQLLKKIFSETDNSIIQFIGDPNQSIYFDHSWEPHNPLSLSISHRVSENISRIINLLTTVRKDLICRSCQFDNEIPPHLIIYDINSNSSLEEAFANLIVKYNLHMKRYANMGFYIVGWNVKPFSNENDRNLIRLETLFPGRVITEKNSPSVNLRNTKDIINWISQLLYRHSSMNSREQEHIKNQKDFISYIKERDKDKWQLALFYICDAINKGDMTKFRRYMKRLVEVLKSYDVFDNQESIDTLINEIASIKSFITPTYTVCDVPLTFASVHASKGRTYAATMYVETAYQGHNDSDYLFPTLFPQDGVKAKKQSQYAIEAMKMAYVGFSRPIGLLCYAVHKNSVSKHIKEQICSQGWEIVDISQNNHV